MSDVGDALNTVAEIVGEVIAPIAFPDTCSIQTYTATKSTSGGKVKGTITDAYTTVPIAYKPTQQDYRTDQAGKTRSAKEYTLIMPVLDTVGARYNFNIEIHRIVVDARGDEPAKTFRPLAVGNKSGIAWEVTAEAEGVFDTGNFYNGDVTATDIYNGDVTDANIYNGAI